MKGLLAFVFLLFTSPCWAVTPTFDAENHTTGTGVSTLSFSLTVGGGCTNPIVLAVLDWQLEPHGTTSALTIASVGATNISQQSNSTDTEHEFWYRTGVSTGANTIAMTLDSTANSITFGASSYCGVNQSVPLGPVATASDLGTTPATVNVTSNTGETVVGAVMLFYNGTLTAIQTQRSNFTQDSTNHSTGTSEAVGAATVTTSWTLGGVDDNWMIVGVSLKPFTGGGSVVRHHPILIQ